MKTKYQKDFIKNLLEYGTVVTFSDGSKFATLDKWYEIIDAETDTAIEHLKGGNTSPEVKKMEIQAKGQPIGYLLNGRFYKSLEELRGFTTGIGQQPIPLYK